MECAEQEKENFNRGSERIQVGGKRGRGKLTNRGTGSWGEWRGKRTGRQQWTSDSKISVLTEIHPDSKISVLTEICPDSKISVLTEIRPDSKISVLTEMCPSVTKKVP